MDVVIRKAMPEEYRVLTRISFESKGYWNYPDEYFKAWMKELTISQDYISKNIVYVAEKNNEIAGFFSILFNRDDFWAGNVFVNKGFWLDHMFILPEFIGQGIGSELIQHVKTICRDIKCEKLYIFADPHARGFYLKAGALYIRESPSSIKGRTIPFFELDIMG